MAKELCWLAAVVESIGVGITYNLDQLELQALRVETSELILRVWLTGDQSGHLADQK
jgi:hypothetical protein